MDFEWRVAGSKDFMPYYEKLTGIGHQRVSIELLGKIEEEQIVEELKAADFFIHPSIIDNSPHSVCEAQMIGCPVIASNVGGVPQLVEHGVTGWLYPYNEPHSLVFLIGNLLRDTELLLRVSKNAVKTALERHDPETIVRKMKEAYETIITN
jgi:glycosyltransferase involved in cell wall biosynthesis